MNIELYSLLATLVLVATLASVVFATASYAMFRIKEHRKLMRKKAAAGNTAPAPDTKVIVEPPRPQFFKPYEPSI